MYRALYGDGILNGQKMSYPFGITMCYVLYSGVIIGIPGSGVAVVILKFIHEHSLIPAEVTTYMLLDSETCPGCGIHDMVCPTSIQATRQPVTVTG